MFDHHNPLQEFHHLSFFSPSTIPWLEVNSKLCPRVNMVSMVTAHMSAIGILVYTGVGFDIYTAADEDVIYSVL